MGPAEYHKRQFDRTYRSTVAFADFVAARANLSADGARVLDIGSGEGANLWYLSQRFPACDFVGIDLNPDLVRWGNEELAARGVSRVALQQGDVYALDAGLRDRFEGIISLQTLSWLPDYEAPLRRMMELNAEWIAVSSLFFDGRVTARVEIEDHTTPLAGQPFREAFYNVYALPLVRDLLADGGYQHVEAQPFEIDVDLPRPPHDGMGTYTEMTTDGRRLQISGPLLMSWYFVFARRTGWSTPPDRPQVET